MIIPVHSRPFADKGKAFSGTRHERYAPVLAAMLLAAHSTVTASPMNVHRYTQINTDEENCGVKICGYLCPSVDKFLMRS
ncbi:MAG: hypothetical protein LBT01_05055, partial [Spirochaetaceae bacterium]|nr:hypothetical protein [Spirochaetaceae bacterium]